MMREIKAQPAAINALTNLLESEPPATDFNITILYADDEDASPNDSESYPHRAFAKVGPHLGINASDLPFLARDFKNYYFSLRPFLSTCDKKNSDEENHKDFKEERSIMMSHIMAATTCLLLLCPDHSTAWADRRRLLLEQSDDFSSGDGSMMIAIFQKELKFLDLVFTQHSKAPSSWAHRKWICQNLIDCFLSQALFEDDSYQDNVNSIELKRWKKIIELIENEIKVCTSVAEQYPKNYYAWTHRIVTMQSMLTSWKKAKSVESFECDRKDESKVEIITELLNYLFKKETLFIQEWLKHHISDHSCVHYGIEILRLFLVHGVSKGGYCESKKLNSFEWGLHELFCALESCKKMLTVRSYVTHESIWRYRRLCSVLILRFVSGDLQDCQMRDSSTLITPLVLKLISQFIKGELNSKSIEENSSDQMRNSIPIEEQNIAHKFARSYRMWIWFNMKKYWTKEIGNSLFNLIDSCEFDDLDSVWNELTEDDSIVHNFWRKMPKFETKF